MHTNAICDTYAYNLLSNHFHLVVKIKSLDQCKTHFEKIKQVPFNSSTHDMADILMERFSNLCNSYTKRIIRSLADKERCLSRSQVSCDNYFCNLINYIHFNAVHHGFCKNPLDWKWSSLHAFLVAGRTAIKKKETLQTFGAFRHSRSPMPAWCNPYQNTNSCKPIRSPRPYRFTTTASSLSPTPSPIQKSPTIRSG